jgi:intein/homing endonuclease
MDRKHKNMEELFENGKELIAFYREHPCTAAYELLGVDFAPIQRLVFRDMWFKNYVIATCGRGYGKTFALGVLAALSALLYPGNRIGLIGPVFRQSKMIFHEVEKLYDQSAILREACVKRPTRGSDTCFLKFKSVGGKTPSYIEALPLGDGCLSRLSAFLTYDSGFGYISDSHDLNVEENHYIDRKEVVWGNSEFKESDRSLCNGKKKTVKIKTKKGFKSEGTPNHKFKIVRNGKIIWCRFDEMVIGDRILIDRTYRWHKGNSDVTKEQAYALGLMLGDGNYTNKYRLRYTTEDEELIHKLNIGTGLVFSQAPSDNVHYDVQGKNSVSNWLDFWDIELTYTKDKKLPKKILSATRECMSACISGLYDSDGHVQVSTAKGGTSITIGFTNTSEELVDQLHYILLHYGIVAVKIERGRNENWNTIYELLITGKDVKIFYDEIGFGLKRKDSILKTSIEAKTKWFSYEDIPVIKDIMVDISTNNRIKKGCGTKESRYCRASVIKNKKYITPYLVDCFLKTYGHINDGRLSSIEVLNNPDIYYDEIVSIGEGEAVTYDIHVPDGNEYCANGFFSHNSKIRGSRFYVILVDELAQVPDQILDMVLRPMGATSLAPMERVRRLEEQKRLIEAGLATEDDFAEEKVNKMVMTSSGYYKFNHMWRRMRDHWKMMGAAEKEGKDCDYSVWQVPYWDLPRGFLDMNNINEAKRIMSHSEFRMEYEGAMVDDSEGFFKASLLEDCTLGSGFDLNLTGGAGNFIMGVDPNQGGADSCGVVILELGNEHKIVNVLELKKQTTQALTRSVQSLCEQYNIIRIYMDKGGGGKAIMDLLEDGYDNKELILDRSNPDNDFKDGRHILEMVNFNPAWISDANFTTKSLFESKHLLFPELPVGASDVVSKAYDCIHTLKSQLLSIVVTQTTTGILHFDTPSKTMHKDLYSALILAAHGARTFEKELEEDDKPILHHGSGMVRLRNGSGANFNPFSAAVQTSNSLVTDFNSTNNILGSAILKKRIKKK